MRKLLDIAMAVAARPRLLLLDEPTSGVSADEKFRLMDMVMEALKAQGVTVLFVEHDMDIVSRYTHRILAFYEGRIIADGDPGTVLQGRGSAPLRDRRADLHVPGGTRMLQA